MQSLGDVGFKGDVSFKVIKENGTVFIIAPEEKAKLSLGLIRNRLRVAIQRLQLGIAKPFMKMARVVWLESELRLRKYDHKRGIFINYGVVSRRLTTTVGREFLVDDWVADSQDIGAFDDHGFGTGAVAENVADTVLGAEVETRETGTQAEGTSTQVVLVATHTFAGTFAITEHGIFDLTAAGTLWDRSVFGAINVVANDAIEATYTLSVNDGG